MKVRWIVAVSLCLMTLVVHGGDVLIVESTVAAFEPGQTWPGKHEVQLKVGETLRVLSDDGRTAVLQGPYVGPLDATTVAIEFDNRQASNLLDRLFGPDRVERTGLGGVRGPQAATLQLSPASPWLIPTMDHRVHCLRTRDAAPRLWRVDAERPAILTVTTLTSGVSAIVTWAAGAHEVGWPPTVPLEDDAMYLLRADEGLASVNVQIRFVSRTLPEDLRLALWLAAKACDAQARYFATLASN